MSRIVETKMKCPKCGSRELWLKELWKDHAIDWEVENGKFDRDEGYQSEGSPYKLEGDCKKCKHKWRIKKATQIDDLT